MTLFDPAAIGINIAAFQFMNSIASPSLNTIMGYLAESFYIVLPLIAIFLYLKKDMNFYSYMIIAVALFVISEVLKYIFAEPRPCSLPSLSWINQVGCESSYSFPSNHATVLTGLTFFVGKYKYIRVLYVIWLILVLFGRVYLGAHYLTDVIAGVIISLIIAYIAYRYREKANRLLNSIVRRVVPSLALKEV